MAGFMREILNTLSYDPSAPAQNVEVSALSRLDQRLSGLAPGHGGGKGLFKLRPRECTVWNGNPRDVEALSAGNCRSLIESIAAEGGNRIPVLVRTTSPGSEHPYQLLVGSRRRFSVDWLNHNGRPQIFLNALVVELTDEEAFRLADIENRERADISELDRARSYQAAVDRFYAGVQSRMAQALGLSNSQLSRLLSLAQMPDEVVGAFATREDLRVRHSEILTPLLRRAEQRALLIAAAVEIAAEQQVRAGRNERMIPAPVVLGRLKQAALNRVPEKGRGTAIVFGGETLGRVTPLKSGGGLAVELALAADTDLDGVLAELREMIDLARASPPEA